ncbi:hypothetical protein RFF05_07015 [Bengtsoniella intestinalis]|uniref:hypothetical protein n=1 Tax=Bengtsoniella intestinalis TaxID=3073143 RepID=UPI00391F1A2D
MELSAQEVKNLSLRTVRCPLCNFPIDRVYQDSTGHKHVKCRKCKFEGAINLAYFRRKPGGRHRRKRYYGKRKSTTS